jgi:adenylate cyclase
MPPDRSSDQIEATFCFIDLAGFTALTEAQGDLDAANIATGFAELTRSVLDRDERLIKTIGDAVLLTSPTPDSAVALVERILVAAASELRFPALRAGLHHGTAILRDGDVFGAAVNLASRVASEAHPAEVLGTHLVAEAARARNLAVAELGEVMLKNVRDAIPLYSIALILSDTDTPIDPVCQLRIDRRSATGRLQYKGKEYWFCSLTCAAAFASNPAWHVARVSAAPPPNGTA